MNDFDMYLARLEANPHEPVSENALTRMIAERLGYKLTPRFKQAPSQWQLATQYTSITFKAKGTDLDAAWHVARTKGYTPNWVGSVDAALKLPLARFLFYQIITPMWDIPDDVKHIVDVYNGISMTSIVTVTSKQPALAICAAWWQAVNSEQKEDTHA